MLPRSTGRAALLILAIAVSLTAAGCAREKPKPRLAYEERPVELLYSTGAFRLDQRRWTEAVAYFQEVERQHPYSEWSRRAILMTGFAHYQANMYADAIKDSERFIQLYPGNASVVYAYYLKSICYFEQIVDVGRDQAATEQALASLNEVITRFPRSEYAADARLKIDMVNDQLAGKEMAIGRYYLRQGQTIAAIGRFRTVVDRYQTTTHTPEALYRLVESYLTVGLLQEATSNGAVLGHNFPGDPWYTDAYNLLTDRGLQPAIEPKTPGAKRSYLDRLLGRGTALPPPVETAPAVAPPAEAVQPVAAPPAAEPKKKGVFGRLFRR
ncbi:MAG: outer membrane protein assembly factor BamD [Caulobacter sp.]|nr:outer membrane protein assembly factor BamD [Caulobacter sp.]